MKRASAGMIQIMRNWVTLRLYNDVYEAGPARGRLELVCKGTAKKLRLSMISLQRNDLSKRRTMQSFKSHEGRIKSAKPKHDPAAVPFITSEGPFLSEHDRGRI
jgi:hypothetical protein